MATKKAAKKAVKKVVKKAVKAPAKAAPKAAGREEGPGEEGGQEGREEGRPEEGCCQEEGRRADLIVRRAGAGSHEGPAPRGAHSAAAAAAGALVPLLQAGDEVQVVPVLEVAVDPGAPVGRHLRGDDRLDSCRVRRFDARDDLAPRTVERHPPDLCRQLVETKYEKRLPVDAPAHRDVARLEAGGETRFGAVEREQDDAALAVGHGRGAPVG